MRTSGKRTWVNSRVCCCLFCRVYLFGLKYKNLRNRTVCRVVECNLGKAVLLVLYVGMAFVCCQFTWEWHLCVANLNRNGIFVLPSYKGMVFLCSQFIQEWRLCIANLQKNGICLLQIYTRNGSCIWPTYIGIAFVCGSLHRNGIYMLPT